METPAAKARRDAGSPRPMAESPLSTMKIGSYSLHSMLIPLPAAFRGLRLRPDLRAYWRNGFPLGSGWMIGVADRVLRR